MVNNNIYKLSLFLNKLEIRYLNFFHHFLCFSATFTQKGRIEQFVSVRGYSNSEPTGLLRNDFWSNKFFRSSKSYRTTLKALCSYSVYYYLRVHWLLSPQDVPGYVESWPSLGWFGLREASWFLKKERKRVPYYLLWKELIEEKN